MNSNKINTKTIARIAAVQTIYQYKLESSDQNIDFIVQQMISFYQDERAKDSHTNSHKAIKIKLSISHLQLLVKSVVENLTKIDQTIAKHLTSEWTMNNMPILLLALLRVAICELQFFPDIPNKVIINEFTDITSDMLSDHEVGFVNSILDTISKEYTGAQCHPVH